MVSEHATLPPPRPPLTDREKVYRSRLLEDADAIEEALRDGIAPAIRQLTLRGHDFIEVQRLRDSEMDVRREGTARAYVLAVVLTLRRAAYLVDPAPQGIA